MSIHTASYPFTTINSSDEYCKFLARAKYCHSSGCFKLEYPLQIFSATKLIMDPEEYRLKTIWDIPKHNAAEDLFEALACAIPHSSSNYELLTVCALIFSHDRIFLQKIPSRGKVAPQSVCIPGSFVMPGDCSMLCALNRAVQRTTGLQMMAVCKEFFPHMTATAMAKWPGEDAARRKNYCAFSFFVRVAEYQHRHSKGLSGEWFLETELDDLKMDEGWKPFVRAAFHERGGKPVLADKWVDAL